MPSIQMEKTKPSSGNNLRNLTAYLLLAPTIVFELILFALPLVLVFIYSFSRVDALGRITFEFTLENYAKVFTVEFVRIILRTFALAIVSTLICLVIGYPIAYYIGFKERKHQNLLLMMIIIPFWLSFVARTYSIISIFSSNGLLNQFLTLLGFVGDKPQWLYTLYSVIIGMIYNYLPMIVLPIYASVEKLDPSLIEAAGSLGADRMNVFLKVTLPLTLPGIFAGCILVFIPSIGEFLVPELLGGIEWYMIGNYLWTVFLTIGNYAFGSALSIVLIGIVAVFIFIYKVFLKRG